MDASHIITYQLAQSKSMPSRELLFGLFSFHFCGGHSSAIL